MKKFKTSKTKRKLKRSKELERRNREKSGY
jgi:hypothetical protein